MEMRRTYEEEQSDMDHMIKQVELLSVMIKEMQENRAGPGRYVKREEEEDMSRTEVMNSTKTAVESEALPGAAEVKKEELVRGEPQEKVQTPDKRTRKPMSTTVDKEHVTPEWSYRRTKIPRKDMPRMEWSLYWLKVEPWPESPEEGKLPL